MRSSPQATRTGCRFPSSPMSRFIAHAAGTLVGRARIEDRVIGRRSQAWPATRGPRGTASNSGERVRFCGTGTRRRCLFRRHPFPVPVSTVPVPAPVSVSRSRAAMAMGSTGLPYRPVDVPPVPVAGICSRSSSGVGRGTAMPHGSCRPVPPRRRAPSRFHRRRPPCRLWTCPYWCLFLFPVPVPVPVPVFPPPPGL